MVKIAGLIWPILCKSVSVGEQQNEKESGEGVRIDAWAWAVRLYKTRALAVSACKKEQVLINGQRCKPSRQIRIGDEIQIKRGILTRTVKVKELLQKRVGAKRVEEFLIDLTPAEEYERAAEASRLARVSSPQRETGAGRPTKRERRDLEQLMNDAVADDEQFEEFLKAFTRRP